ncbi:MAG: murein biosynthesis integral membrane protein MurJ [Desulfomonile tiedjei]|nr:murein biosynthesis integral membrane protein MurJ [Desulfomonile tiedjei]
MADNRTESQSFSEEKAMTRAAGVVGMWTVLSRILGFARDVVTALFLGAGLGADAFFVAFRIPNLLRRLFAEGAFSAAFVPTYVETLQKEGRSEAARLARIAFTFVAIVLAVVTVLGIITSPWIVRLFAPGFIEYPEKFDLTVRLNQIMFPYIFFISLVALASGVLNSLGHFSAPAAAPVILNLCMIGGVLVFCTHFAVEPVYALAWAVFAAGILQLALQLPFMSLLGVRLRPDFHFSYPPLKRVGRLFVPAALGGAVYQINVLVGTMLASLLPAGGVSWLWYADRIVELPLGIFAIALGTAVLPSMSRQAANGDIAALIRSVSFSLRVIAFFTIPASVALVVLREPIVAVLFQRGLFSVADTEATAYALLYYTLGLWAFSGLKVVTQAFFSLKDTKTPVKASVVSVVVNLVAGLLLMGPMAQGGLALATSLAAAINVALLFVLLTRRLGQFPLAHFTASLARILAASLVMGGLLVYGRTLGEWGFGLTTHNGMVLLGCILGGLVVFAGSAWLFRCGELRSVVSLIKKRAV